MNHMYSTVALVLLLGIAILGSLLGRVGQNAVGDYRGPFGK